MSTLSVIIANPKVDIGLNKFAKTILVCYVYIKVHLSRQLHDNGYIAAKFCCLRTPILKMLSMQCSLSSRDRFGDYAGG